MKVIDKVFQDSILEAAQAHSAYILEKEKNDAIVAKSFTVFTIHDFLLIIYNVLFILLLYRSLQNLQE